MQNRPEFIRAAILVEQNKPLVVDNIQLPKNLLPGQVLVKLLTSGICGSQLGEISGAKGNDPYLPHLMGHEGCAEVLDVGEGATNLKIGDKVILHWRKGNGIQSAPPIYSWNGKKLNAGWVTTFNTHAIVSENRCTKINTKIDNDLAALFGCAITTGFGVVENNAKIKMGDSVVVFGAGGVGLNIIQACSLHSAYPIIAVDIFDNRLDLARKFGATHVINTKKKDFLEEIEKLSLKGKLDVFIDNTGNTKIIETGYELINSFGKLILVGVPRKGSNINIFSLPLHFGKTIVGSHGGECNPSKDIPRFINIFNQEIAFYKELITKRINLDNINEAFELMKTGSTAGRIMIDFS
tara:strand:+ start:9746 stop:10801 length:1056 start_codon:yes stop_codon:yes gene_type:complete